jgi:hypothetical protein
MEMNDVTADIGSIPQEQKRIVHVFKVPEKLQKLVKVKTVSLYELSVEEEIMATGRAGQNLLQITYRCAEQALAAIDSRPVSLSDGTADVAYAKMHPKLRQLVVRAYNAIHNPEKDELDDFLGSQLAEIG